MKLVHPRSSPRRSKTNDPGAWIHYRRASRQKSRARHFRRIVDRVRDDDGDLEEVLLEPRSRTTNNNSCRRWAEIDFPIVGDHDSVCESRMWVDRST